MFRAILVSVCVLFLASCQTQYSEYDGSFGVSAYPMGDDLYRITARGNPFTDQMTVMDFILLKAAETAIQKGYDTFAIIGAVDNSTRNVSRGPGVVTTSIVGGTATSFVTPPQTYTFDSPGAHVLVKIGNLKAGESLRSGMFNARQTYDAISPRVQRR